MHHAFRSQTDLNNYLYGFHSQAHSSVLLIVRPQIAYRNFFGAIRASRVSRTLILNCIICVRYIANSNYMNDNY